MFTGLVETTGILASRAPKAGGNARLVLTSALGSLELGESIAVDGVCLTVDRLVGSDGAFEADASPETLARTTLGALPIGGKVNLERALRVGDRLGGHIVSGHVDGVGEVDARTPSGDAVTMTFRAPNELARFIAEKGSITVSGVSLTVNAVRGDAFDVMLIPHTLGKTSLGALRAGDRVNLEVDVLARYVARLMERPSTAGTGDDDPRARDAAWMERLRNAGLA